MMRTTRCNWCGQTCGVDGRGSCVACGAPRGVLVLDLLNSAPQLIAVITVPGRLTDAEMAHIQQCWREMFAGQELGQRLIILEEGIKLELPSVKDARAALRFATLGGKTNGS
jgi:hypothetical protein